MQDYTRGQSDYHKVGLAVEPGKFVVYVHEVGRASCLPAGNESHAGQVFTCVAALALAGRLDLCDKDLLCWW